MKTKNKLKYLLASILLSGLILPFIVKAGSIDDILKVVLLGTMVPDGSCIRSMDADVEGSSERVEDERGISPATFGLIGIVQCAPGNPPEICQVTGSGSMDGRFDDETHYSMFVSWGRCVSGGDEGGGGSILRDGLNSLRSIFPSRLSSERGIINTIGSLIRWVLGITGAILLAAIFYAGFLYLTAAGNEKSVEKAKNVLTWAVIGTIIIFGSWIIADFIISALTRGA